MVHIKQLSHCLFSSRNCKHGILPGKEQIFYQNDQRTWELLDCSNPLGAAMSEDSIGLPRQPCRALQWHVPSNRCIQSDKQRHPAKTQKNWWSGFGITVFSHKPQTCSDGNYCCHWIFPSSCELLMASDQKSIIFRYLRAQMNTKPER